MLSSATDLFMPRTFEKREVSSAKFYTLILFHQIDHLYQSQIKKGPNADPCGMPELIFLHPDV